MDTMIMPPAGLPPVPPMDDMDTMPAMPPSVGLERGPTIQPDGILDPDALIDELRARAEESLGPKYPSWLYKTNAQGVRVLSPPRQPDDAEFETWIKQDMLRYGDFLRRVRYDLAAYRGLETGVYRDFNPDAEDAYWSREIAIQCHKIMAMISGSPHRITYPYKTKMEKEYAANMEAFALWFYQQWKWQHRSGGNSNLVSDLAWYGMVEGRQAVTITCDLDDGDFPWWVNVIDPATIFPLHGEGKRGMLRYSRSYAATLGEVLDHYDPDGEKRFLDRWLSKNNRDREGLDLTMDVQVDQCVTRWWDYKSIDGVRVDLVEHEYGFCPAVYNLAPGEAGTASMPGGDGLGPTAEEIRKGYAGPGSSSKSRDLSYKGQSFFHNVISALKQKNKLLGIHMVAAQQAINPATQTSTGYVNEPPEPADLRPGKDNLLRPGETRSPIVPTARPLDTEPLLQALNSEISKAVLPDQVFGHTEGSNITGFASDSLIAAALDIVGPIFDLTQTTVGDTIYVATNEFRNFGILTEGLEDGKLIIPSQNRGTAMGSKPAKLPPYAQEVLQTIMQKIRAPGAALGPPAPPPPPEPAPPVRLPASAQSGAGTSPDGAPVPPGGPGARNNPQFTGNASPGGSPAPGGPGANPFAGGGGGAPVDQGNAGGAGVPQAPVAPPSPLQMAGGSLIGMPGYVDPVWTIPANGINEDEPVVYIDRTIIDTISSPPIFTFNSLSLNNKTVLINYLNSAVEGKLMPRSIAMAQLPEIDSVAEAFQMILAEEGITNPEMLKNIYYPRSLAEQGDFEGWLMYLVNILLPQMMPLLSPAGMMGPSGPAPSGGGEKGQAPIEQPGNSVAAGRQAAQLGRGPGSQGQPVGAPGG